MDVEKNECLAVLFLIFNRPDLTRQSFAAIRSARPERLFIAADGPRPDRPEDDERCAESRAVVERVDWPCEVKTLFRDENLGCRKAVSEAITWFFKHVEEGIVLEDDCVPDPSFFPFCAELLERYRTDTRVGMISGNNYKFKLYDPKLSYSFSKHGQIWGWAIWRRAWQLYDSFSGSMSLEEEIIVKANMGGNAGFAESWWNEAKNAMSEESDSWAYIWGAVRYANNLLTIRPRINLVGNIGFGKDGTHTKGRANSLYTKTDSIGFPLVHPRIVVADSVADSMLEEFRAPTQVQRSFRARLLRRARKIVWAAKQSMRQWVR